MTKQEAISHFGTQVALARALGIGKAAVNAWKTIPLDRQCHIEVVTNGALKADRALLFPDRRREARRTADAADAA